MLAAAPARWPIDANPRAVVKVKAGLRGRRTDADADAVEAGALGTVRVGCVRAAAQVDAN